MRLLWVLAALMLPSCWVGKEEVTAWEQTRSEIGTEVEGLLSGAAIAGVGDVNEDGLDDLLIGSAYASHAGQDDRVGAAFLMSGPASGGVMLGDAAAFIYGELDGSGAGAAVAGPGDLDGDGHVDLLVGARWLTDDMTIEGGVYGVLGPASGVMSLGDADFVIIGVSPYEIGIYMALAGAGDIDQDGLPDSLVGGSGSVGSVAYVVSGGQSGDVDLSDALQITFPQLGSQGGRTLAGLCDVDADGVSDVGLGDAADDTSGDSAGAAYVLLGPLPTGGGGSLSVSDADAAWFGEDDYSSAGSDVSCSGDLDGDGKDDLAVGASNYSYGDGAVYVVFGPAQGQRNLSGADVVLTAEDDDGDAFLGGSVEAAGDLDGDGFDDLVIGAPGYDGSREDSGASLLVYGPLSSADAFDLGVAVSGRHKDDMFGATVVGAGDLDGDGLSDVVAGGPVSDVVLIIYGQEDL